MISKGKAFAAKVTSSVPSLCVLRTNGFNPFVPWHFHHRNLQSLPGCQTGGSTQMKIVAAFSTEKRAHLMKDI